MTASLAHCVFYLGLGGALLIAWRCFERDDEWTLIPPALKNRDYWLFVIAAAVANVFLSAQP